MLPSPRTEDDGGELPDVARSELIQAMEGWVDGADGFFDLEPERSKIGGFGKGIYRQRADLGQHGLPLLRREVCRQRVNIADGRGVAL
jgi:hypothetical protein